MDVKLVVVGGEAKPAEIKLKLPTIIGRGKDATLMLPHSLVSRQHTEIFTSDDHLYVRDLGSLNGTFVNNERIEGEHELKPGELLTIGTVTFRAIYDSPNGQSAPPSVEPVAQAPVPATPLAATVQANDQVPMAQPIAEPAAPIAEPAPDFADVTPVEIVPAEPESVEYADLGSPAPEAAPSPVGEESDDADEEAFNAFLNDLD